MASSGKRLLSKFGFLRYGLVIVAAAAVVTIFVASRYDKEGNIKVILALNYTVDNNNKVLETQRMTC